MMRKFNVRWEGNWMTAASCKLNHQIPLYSNVERTCRISGQFVGINHILPITFVHRVTFVPLAGQTSAGTHTTHGAVHTQRHCYTTLSLVAAGNGTRFFSMLIITLATEKSMIFTHNSKHQQFLGVEVQYVNANLPTLVDALQLTPDRD